MKGSYKAIPAKNVDEYLQEFPEKVRTALEQVRQAIKEVAPQAEEVISYQVPSYKYLGPLVYFAGFKNHCSFFVVNKNILQTFAAELKAFKVTGSTIHFTTDKPLPAVLIQKMVKVRMAENTENNRAKKLKAKAKSSKTKIAAAPGT